MSSKIMGMVWDYDLDHAQQLVLLAMADHADHAGNNVYPSIGYLAWKTGYSARQVQRVINKLVELGAVECLTMRGKPTSAPHHYKVTLENLPLKKDYQQKVRQNVTPDKMSPQGDIAMSGGGRHSHVIQTISNPSDNLNTVAATPLLSQPNGNSKTPPKVKPPKATKPRQETPESVLFKAIDHCFFNDAGYRNLIVWGILNGRSKQGVDGIIKAECERQHKTRDQLDYNALSLMVPKFKASLPIDERTGQPIELRDPLKFCVRWEGWRNTTNIVDCPPRLDYDPNCPHRFDEHPCDKGTIYLIDEKGNPYREPCECNVSLRHLKPIEAQKGKTP